MLICMQKINFITHFFLKISQRYSKCVILGNLGMSDLTHLKMISLLGSRLSTGKKSTLFFTFSLIYCKDIVNLFWILWSCLSNTAKVVLSNCIKCLCLVASKKYYLFWGCCKDMKSYFGYFGHA